MRRTSSWSGTRGGASRNCFNGGPVKPSLASIRSRGVLMSVAPTFESALFGVRRQSAAATALLVGRRRDVRKTKAVSRFACHRTPKASLRRLPNIGIASWQSGFRGRERGILVEPGQQPSPHAVGSEPGRDTIFLKADASLPGEIREAAPANRENRFELENHVQIMRQWRLFSARASWTAATERRAVAALVLRTARLE